ncbi:MAG: high-potential iron-sulfur protein [Rubrivivax sp.]|nr:high-potential iron-sulfur protein [Rubrivivax sp.]
MTRTNRRIFLVQVAAAGSALAAGGAAHAQARVEETDDNAIALGYKHDTTKVDSKKYPSHRPDQKCNNCAFWQGTPTDAWAGCSMFGRKHIAAPGWCTAWRKPG